MKKLTRILSIVLVAVASLMLVACGKTEAPTTTKAPAATTTKTPATTTKAPQVTTQAPVTTTQAPVVTTQAPVTQPPVTTTVHTHELAHHEAAPGDCQNKGTVEYWECSGCNKKFSDANGTTEITSIEGTLGSHQFGELVPEVPATSANDGTKAYKTCSVCHKNFSEDGTELTDLVIPATSRVTLAKVNDTVDVTTGNYLDYLVSKGSTLSVDNGIKVTKTELWTAFETKNIVFTANTIVKVDMEVTFYKYHAWDVDNFFITLGENLGELKRSAKLDNIATTVERKHTITTYFTLGDSADYVASVSNYGGDSEYTISKLTFTVVSEAGTTTIETEPPKVAVVSLANANDTFTFTGENYNDYIGVRNATLSLDGGIKVTKTGQWVALETKNINFAANSIIKVEMEITFTSAHAYDADNFFLTFGDGSAYSVSKKLENISNVTGRKHTIVRYFTLGNYDSYALSISNYGGDSVYTLNSFKLTVVSEAGSDVTQTEAEKVSLANVNDTFAYTATNYADYTTLKGCTLSIDNGIKVTKTANWTAFETKNITFAANTIIKVEMEVTFSKVHDWDKDNFFITFGENLGELKRSETLSNLSTILGRKHSITAYFTLGNSADYVASVSNYGGDSEYTISKLQFTVVSEAETTTIETEPAPVTTVTLANVNDSFTLTSENYADYLTAKNATISSDNGMKVTKTTNWVAFETKNITFAANTIVKVELEITFTSAHDWDKDNFFVTFGDGTAYSVSKNLTNISTVTGRKHTIVRYFTLGDYDSYALSFSNYGGDTVYTLGLFKLTIVSEAGSDLTQTEVEKVTLANANDTITFTGDNYNDYLDAKNATFSSDNGIKVNKTTNWVAFETKNITFTANTIIKVELEITFTNAHDWDKDNFFVTFGDGTAYSVSTNLTNISTITGRKHTIVRYLTLGNYDSYVLSFSNYGGDTIYTLNTFKLTVVSAAGTDVTETEEVSTEVDLTALNSKYAENFDSLTAETLANHFISSGSANVTLEDGAMKVAKTAQWQGLKGINFNFANGATYSFSFKLKVTQMDSTDYFELLFADGTAAKVSQSLATFVTVGETVNVSFNVTLLADATEFLIGCWSGSAIYSIDDLVIERTA